MKPHHPLFLTIVPICHDQPPQNLPIILAVAVEAQYDVQPFKVNIFSGDVSHLASLVQLTRLPSGNEFSGSDATFGIPRDDLKSLRDEWVDIFDWEPQQYELNKYMYLTYSMKT
jgi:hypothetical protein